MMPDATPRAAAVMWRRATRYAVIGTGPNGESVLVGFTSRRSRFGLLVCLQSRGDEIVRECGVTDDTRATFLGGRNATAVFGSWTFTISNRTELECLGYYRQAP